MDIKTRAQSCLTAFNICLQQVQLVGHPIRHTVETQLERFMSWLSNISVLASYKASLDHRLRKTPAVERLVVSILSAIHEGLENCLGIMHSEPCAACECELRHCDLKWPICSECSKLSSKCDYDYHFGVKIDILSIEIAESFDSVSEEITTLHRLSNTIRKASMDARNMEIDDTFPIFDEEGRDIKEDLELMFTDLVNVSLPEAPQNVRERVATTMFVRRRRACFRQGQKDMSKPQEPAVIQSIPPVANDPRHGQPSITPTASAKSGVSDPKLNVPIMGQMPDKDESQVQTATTLSHQQFLKASTPSVTSSNMGRTVAMDTLQGLPFPPRPRVYDRMEYDKLKPAIIAKHGSNVQELLAAEALYLRNGIFDKGSDIKKLVAAEKMSYREQRQKAKKDCEVKRGRIACPICLCLFDNKIFSSKIRWRTHILHDIQAYVCISANCSTTFALYSRSRDWLTHMQEHVMKWHCDAEPHAPLKFDSAVEYESHMLREHKGTFTNRQLPYLTKGNAWADDPLYEQCPLCKTSDIKGSVIEHVIGHLRYLALRSLPNMDDRQSLSTIDDTLSSGSGQIRTTIREASFTTDRPLFTTPLPKRPDDDLAYGKDPYEDWNGYDAFISLFPDGIPRLVEGKPVKTFPLPPEPSQENPDEYGYPTSWPADPSVNFVWPGVTRSDGNDHEWSSIWSKIDPVSINEEAFPKEELGNKLESRYALDAREGEEDSGDEEVVGHNGIAMDLSVTGSEGDEVTRGDDPSLEYLTMKIGPHKRKRKYWPVRPLGQGTFSKVVLATSERLLPRTDFNESSEKWLNPKYLVAIKIVQYSPAGGADEERVELGLKREVELLQSISHPCLIYLQAADWHEHETLLVLNYCPGGDLFDLASQQREALTPAIVQRMFAELVSAVQYLHSKWIVHRDIKLENVLLNVPLATLAKTSNPSTYSYPLITLTDLSLGRTIPQPPDSPLLTTKCGSRDYAAPEILLGQPYDGRQTDAWALGVLLYALMEGRLPFDPRPARSGSKVNRDKSRAVHNIVRSDWIWCKFGDGDGDWDPERGADWEGARVCVEGLLKKFKRGRLSMDDLNEMEYIREGIQIEGGLTRPLTGEEPMDKS